MTKMVMTVRGPVAAKAIGYTDAHNHLWIEPVPGAPADAPVLDQATAITAELRDYRAAGGSAIVDCQPGGSGRNGSMLATLAAAADVHVIASTGFHRRRYYGSRAPLWELSAAEAGAHFLAEIEAGMVETRDSGQPVKPGVIKIAAEATLAESPLSLFAGAAQAARASGYAIEMHTERGAAVEAFLDFFAGEGVDPARLIFCHVDKRPAFDLHRRLAEAGVMLEYDTFYRPKYEPEKNVWPLLEQMVAAGLSHRLALATDMADASMWTHYGGGPGLGGLLTEIKPRLETLGLDDQTVEQLLGGNIIRRLAVAI